MIIGLIGKRNQMQKNYHWKDLEVNKMVFFFICIGSVLLFWVVKSWKLDKDDVKNREDLRYTVFCLIGLIVFMSIMGYFFPSSSIDYSEWSNNNYRRP